jgi:prepilin peptidase CpaA
MSGFVTLLSQICLAGFAAAVLAAALSDVKRLIIPNALCATIVALYAVYALSAPTPVSYGWAIGIALAVFAVGAGLFACNLVGGGDVKFLTAVALWAGPEHIASLLAIMGLAGGMIALVMIVARGEMTAFGFRILAFASGQRSAARGGVKVPYGAAIAVGGLYVAWRLTIG